MVTTKTSKPAYSLAEVQRLARPSSVHYRGRKVLYDIDNLGYSPHAVCACLRDLKSHHYHETVVYDDDEMPLDVYKCDWRAAANARKIDSLYIKLGIDFARDSVAIASFHLS